MSGSVYEMYEMCLCGIKADRQQRNCMQDGASRLLLELCLSCVMTRLEPVSCRAWTESKEITVVNPLVVMTGESFVEAL